MNNGIDAGIELIAHNLGGLTAGHAYLLSGQRGTAKTTFVLQFLYQGLKERQTCLLITDETPKAIITHAQLMGMDLAPYLKKGSLIVYEIARRDAYPAAELLREIEKAITENPASRFALEGLGKSPSAEGLAAGVPSLLGKLDAMKTTAFITMEVPVAEAFAPLHGALEQAVAGAFLLEATSDAKVKGFFVEKLAGEHSAGAEFPFTLQPGRGVVEIVKTSAIRFPHHNEH